MASIYEETQRARRLLIRRERRVLSRMLEDWRAVEADLYQRAIAIGEQIELARTAGTPVEQVWLFQQSRVEALLTQARAEIERLSRAYGPFVTEQARAAAIDGATLAARQLSVSTAFATRLSVSAVENIALATTIAPLERLMAEVDIEGSLRRALVNGLARGANPREVARLVQGAVNASKQRTLTIARTEMARAQRWAQMDSFKAAGVQQWEWHCARDARTCAACWSLDGEKFDVDGAVDDHPNGRCSLLPVATGLDLSDVPSADRAWNALTEGERRDILGPSRYELYRSGQISRTDLHELRSSPEWGTSASVKPLARLTA